MTRVPGFVCEDPAPPCASVCEHNSLGSCLNSTLHFQHVAHILANILHNWITITNAQKNGRMKCENLDRVCNICMNVYV